MLFDLVWVLAASLVLSMALTRLMIAWAPKLGLMDTPGERRIHTSPVPRAGGIAVWVSFMIVVAVVPFLKPGPGTLDQEWFHGFALASAVLVAIGIVDDRWGMSAWLKLSGQAGVAAILFFTKGSGIGTFLGMEVPWWLDLAIWVLWTVGIINAFNLIDGLDGLCAGLATISIGALAAVSFVNGRVCDGLVMVAMIGALGGFLRYNFHPAKIFLGDTGSMFIGLFVASAATVSSGERAVVASLLIPLLVAGVPLFDVILAVWRRAGRRWLSQLGAGRAARIFGADKDHLHHRLLAAGFTQRKVAVLLYALAVFITCAAVLPTLLDERAIGITMAALLVAGLLGFRYLAPVELNTSGRVLDLVLKRPPASRMISLGYFCFDVLVILFGLAVAFTIEENGRFAWFERANLTPFVALTLACSLFGLRMAKAHSRHWGRATIRDYWALIIWYSIALQIAFTLVTLVDRNLAWASARIFMMSGTISIVLFTIPRSITPLIREAMIDSTHRRLGRSTGARKRIVLYGAGDLGELFLSHLKTTCPMRLDEMRILGYIDDHPNLKGRQLDGFKIFGGVKILRELVKKYNLHGVVITMTRLRPEQADRLNRICRDCDLTIYRWRPQLHFTKTSQIERELEVVASTEDLVAGA